MPEKVTLALNCGSSSLKFGVYSAEQLLLEGAAEEIALQGAFWTRSAGKSKQEKRMAIADHAAALQLVMGAVNDAALPELHAVGHRVVHGGPKLRDHVRLDQGVRQQLENAVPFAPLHLPASLDVIDAVSKLKPGLPQVICLDTAFHKDLPDVAKTLAFSKAVRSQGIERFGFHGLSVESIVEQLDLVPERLIVAHLGNGSSITALKHGKSVDTSMGLTPTGGVMMGTRCGDIDPGVLIYLLRSGLDAEHLEQTVDHEAGLKGISEKTSDVRELSEARHSDSSCDLALRMFVYQVKKTVAAMASVLGGMDTLVFTGGIGEHASDLRHEIEQGLQFLGSFETKTLPAEEDLQIARITARLAG